MIILGFTQYVQYNGGIVPEVNTQSIPAESMSKHKINK